MIYPKGISPEAIIDILLVLERFLELNEGQEEEKEAIKSLQDKVWNDC